MGGKPCFVGFDVELNAKKEGKGNVTIVHWQQDSYQSEGNLHQWASNLVDRMIGHTIAR